jgi:hypothetical protein
MITIPIERNGQSLMIPPKDTESKNNREDPDSELIIYALHSKKKTTFLIDINKQVHKNDNKLIINIKDVTCEERSQANKLENKEEYHSDNRNIPDTDIPTEKQIQGNKCKSNNTNIQPIPSILVNLESENNNDMDISMTRNIAYEMYKTNKCCAESTEKLIRISKILT